ncbi:MAG: alpha/beta fold hydrolase [Actinomycetota bacterium]
MKEHTKFVESGAQKARLLDRGEGDPVVVLHGWGGRIESMSPVISCLAGGFRVLALDLPGFGASPIPQGTWGSPDYAEFVRDVLTGLGIERASFIGHSFGGKVSLYLAATHADAVDKLVLQGANGVRRPPTLRARAKRVASRAARASGALGPPGRALRQAVYDRIASDDYKQAGEMRPVLVKTVNEDFTHLMPRIAAPTLLVWGSEDDASPPEHGRTMEHLIPDAGLVLFEGRGHFAYLDESERFCRIVRHFIGPQT